MRKLLVCDVEGTIFRTRSKIDGVDYNSTMWQSIAEKLGDEGVRREKELHDRWERGEFDNYLDWVEATYIMHKELSLKKQIFDHLLLCAEYNLGVEEFFAKLNRKQFIPVLISGGFQELVRRAQHELNIPHGHGACEYTFDKSDGFLYSHSLVPCDFEGKYKYVEGLLDRYKLSKESDWVFIGDGKNDCDIAGKAPISFSFNGHPQLKELTNYNIDDRNGIHAGFGEISAILATLTEAHFRAGYDRNVKRKQKENIEKRSLNKAKATKNSKNEIEILDEDYTQPPKLHLSEILENYRIAFVGLREQYDAYRRLEDHFEKNFKLIEANFEHKNNADYKALKRRDFIFICVDCISHSQGWRIEDVGVPFAKIRRFPGQQNDVEPLERAMSNVLYRRYYESANP